MTILADVSREVRGTEVSVSIRLALVKQATSACRVFLYEEMKKCNEMVPDRWESINNTFSVVRIDGHNEGNEEESSNLSTQIPAPQLCKYSDIGLREVMDEWNMGCLSTNLMLPRKDWRRGSQTTSLKYNYHDRKLIATEYISLGE